MIYPAILIGIVLSLVGMFCMTVAADFQEGGYGFAGGFLLTVGNALISYGTVMEVTGGGP